MERDAGVHHVLLDAVEAPEEIEVPPRAAEFAVGDGLQADLLLLLDDALDLAVFHDLELGGGDLALLVPLPRVLQRRRPQQATDVIGAKGRFGALHEIFSRFFSLSCPRRRASSNH
jgi:hypothetical protein